MVTVTPRTGRKRRDLLPTPASDDARARKRVQRVPGMKLTHEELRMAVTVHQQLRVLGSTHKQPRFKSAADKAAFLTKVDAQVIRNATNYIEESGNLPGEEDTSLRGRHPLDLRATRFQVIRNKIRIMNLRGQNPCYESVAHELRGWGWSAGVIRWACKRYASGCTSRFNHGSGRRR